MLDDAFALPVTPCPAERAFSRLRLTESHLRTIMSARRLQSLLRISSNKVAARGATTVQKLGGPTRMSDWGNYCEREFYAKWSTFWALIYLKFVIDDFDIKIPKSSRSVKNMTLLYE